MKKTIIEEGRTSTEAIEKGLKELQCRREDVEIKILENEEKRSFFSILEPRIVKVELTLKEENIKTKKVDNNYKEVKEEDLKKCKENLEKFLKIFINQVTNINYSIKEDNSSINVEINGENSLKLIGYRGETINALQVILSSIGNRNLENKVRVIVNIAGYKEKREETLKQLARKLEKTVKKNGKKIILEPMYSYERKIIHTELQDSKFVKTYSIGEEPRRKVVIEKK